ncbi:tripartite ATP-independent transporter DctP family solute receptor [Rhodobium orientis]|nr:TRAP transporter substrate-binding protein [Rhodobium orientis]MBB4301640.1 tripartite ATP-independent transporter DctP family solute receptor [Rhodobium orientis]
MTVFSKLKTGAAAAVVGLSLACAAGAQAETIVKIATVDGEGDLLKNPYWAYTEVFGTILSNQTGGRYTVQVFPNGQLGDLESLLEQNIRGTIQIAAGLSTGHLAAYYPPVQVLDMPYAFPNLEIAREVLDGEFGQSLSDKIAAEAGVRVLSYMPSAFRNFSNSVRPIHSPKDMEGLKMRTQSIPVHLELVKALGASATPIAWAELYNALQTGVVDGQENAPYTMLLANLQEVQKYYTLDHHLTNIPIVTINEEFYQGLSDADKKAFDFAARQATFAMLGIITAKESQDLKVIRDAGVEIYQPTPEEFQLFVKATKAPVAAVLKDIVGQDLLDELDAAVEKASAE